MYREICKARILPFRVTLELDHEAMREREQRDLDRLWKALAAGNDELAQRILGLR